MSVQVIPIGQGHEHHRYQQGTGPIPKPLRDYLGLEPGSQVDFAYTADGQVVIRPTSPMKKSRKKPSRFDALRGSGKGWA
ncbi:MAG: AbrB/MazE/SpoVT family DNA-binding domain-containing protein [Rhodocyclaceae bacterium]|nr:AbrB/MazE/SpoVT family DNA-binding domain-containing protein [Rhodocyclaceae bacterium]